MTAKPTLSTHHWTYSIEIENDFRNSAGRIEYRWYSPLATRFEACWVAGPAPSVPEGKIHVYSRGVRVNSYSSKDEAMAHARKLANQAPPQCREDFLSHLQVLADAIYGPRHTVLVAPEVASTQGATHDRTGSR